MRRLLAAAAGRTALYAAALLLLASGARADQVRLPRQALPSYAQECAACHMAYPPALLPAASWRRIMSGLDRHFGSDASLDAATLRQVGDWLQAHAGQSRRMAAEPPQDRITRSAWFVREHRELAPEVWRRASIKSPANCLACHAGAERGEFDEERVRIPSK